MNLTLWVLALTSSVVVAACPPGMLLCVEDGGRVDLEPAGLACCRQAPSRAPGGSAVAQDCGSCNDHDVRVIGPGATRSVAPVKVQPATRMSLHGERFAAAPAAVSQSRLPGDQPLPLRPQLTSVILLV